MNPILAAEPVAETIASSLLHDMPAPRSPFHFFLSLFLSCFRLASCFLVPPMYRNRLRSANAALAPDSDGDNLRCLITITYGIAQKSQIDLLSAQEYPTGEGRRTPIIWRTSLARERRRYCCSRLQLFEDLAVRKRLLVIGRRRKVEG